MLMFPGIKSYGSDCLMLINANIIRCAMFGTVLDFLGAK
jgi:hypothetical protein